MAHPLHPGERERLIRALRRRRGRAYARLLAPAFAEMGSGTVIATPFKFEGGSRIKIGRDVDLGTACWLATYDEEARIEIGDGCGLSGNTAITTVREVVIGDHVLIARNVHISDHAHGRDDPGSAIIHQPLADIAPVHVGDGAWLAHGAVLLPGVNIGAGAIVAANSVVRNDVPARHLAAGIPARIIKSLD